MEIKDLILLVMIPILLIGIIAYTGNLKAITGAAVSGESNKKIGEYLIMPSFKAKVDYDINGEYKSLRLKLQNAIDSCKSRQDIEKCMEEQRDLLQWSCEQKDSEALYSFVNKLKDCMSLKDEKAVCKFNFDEISPINEEKNPRNFEIKLTNWYQRIKAELIEDKKVLATEFVNVDALYYIDYDNKDTKKSDADSITIKVRYESKNPYVEEEYALTKENIKTAISKNLVYKSKEGIRFIDSNFESSFLVQPASKIVNLPKTKGMKFCAKTGKQIMAYDSSDGTAKLRDIAYNFAVTFPKSPPKPLENVEVFDAKNAEKNVVLAWNDNSNDANSYSVYYSKKDFLNAKITDAKKDAEIKKLNVLKAPIDIENIDLQKCDFEPVGHPCKYSLYSKALEPGRLYHTSSGKYLYLLSGVEDSEDYNFAVTSVDDDGNEINNDKSVAGNTYILASGKNYMTFAPVDDLAPGKIENLKHEISEGKQKLKWDKPLKNLDGTNNNDLASFNIYYKQSASGISPLLDISYTVKMISLKDAKCDIIGSLACEYNLENMEGLEKGKTYNFAVTATDASRNEYKVADFVQVTIQ